jgi:hypothetical protein
MTGYKVSIIVDDIELLLSCYFCKSITIHRTAQMSNREGLT